MSAQKQADERPQTKANFVTLTNSHAKNAAADLIAFINEKELKRSQIISFTINETEVEEGEQVLTLFYREKPLDFSELPMTGIQFKHFNQNASWAKLLKDAESEGRGVDLISLTHSPKNINDCRNQIMFYNAGSGSSTQKTLRREDGNWPQLANEVRDWCNSYVPPHMLVSVSLYEDAHGEDSGTGINACITHTAGANPKNLAENDDITNKVIYSVDTVAGEGEWEDLFAAATEKVNAIGGQEGHMIASTNDSSNDGGFIVILSWTGLAENNIREVTREAGCGCSIF